MIKINDAIKKGLDRIALTLAVSFAVLGFLIGFIESPYLLKIPNPKYGQLEYSANDRNYAINKLNLPYLHRYDLEYLNPPLSKKIPVGIAFSVLFFGVALFIACLKAWFELWFIEFFSDT